MDERSAPAQPDDFLPGSHREVEFSVEPVTPNGISISGAIYQTSERATFCNESGTDRPSELRR
jgi:hypothetical protein